MKLTNLYEKPKPIKGMLDDNKRIVLSEFEDSETIDIINGGTSANNVKDARTNLEVIRFVEYDPIENIRPEKPPERNIIAKDNGSMFYSNGEEWLPFGSIAIQQESDNGVRTYNEITNILLSDDFKIHHINNKTVRVDLDLVQSIFDLSDVKANPDITELEEDMVLSYSSELNGFVPKYADLDGGRGVAKFIELEDIDLEDLDDNSEDEVSVVFDKVSNKLKFLKPVRTISDLNDVNIDTSLDSSVLVYDEDSNTVKNTDTLPKVNMKNINLQDLGNVEQVTTEEMLENSKLDLVYDVNSNKYIHKSFKGDVTLKLRNGDMSTIPVQRKY